MAFSDGSGGSNAAAFGRLPPPLDDTVVLIPAYREAQGIAPVIEEVRRSLNPRIVVIHRPDGDATGVVARATGAEVVEQAGKGKGDAVRLGLEYVRDHFERARFIGMIDADCTYPSYAMHPMRSILNHRPDVGMVIARRENIANNGATSHAFAWGNRVLAQVHRAMNRIPLDDPLSGLRLFRADVVRDWNPRSRGFDIECELNDYVHNVKGLEISEVAVPYRARVGTKKLRFRHGFLILARMVGLRFRALGTVPSPLACPSDTHSSGTATQQ
ncbi:MAG TPA: glycosyltransferase family 2 protein [Thermoplasmata archaeon]|nr:glycosyltransferase family 2 protein [Thermoplasmata archaeon]